MVAQQPLCRGLGAGPGTGTQFTQQFAVKAGVQAYVQNTIGQGKDIRLHDILE